MGIVRNLSVSCVLIMAALSCNYALERLSAIRQSMHVPVADELLYFPNGEKLQMLSVNYDNVLANYLWFNTVSYFGKHYKTDQNYPWLVHMCNLVTDLDPNHREIYEYCGLLISWEVKKTKAAQKILQKGIDNTNYWRFYYLKGMNEMLFIKDQTAAKETFVAGAALSDAPEYLKRLAAKKIAELEDPVNTLEFLANMVEQAEDPVQRKAMLEQLKKATLEYDLLRWKEVSDSAKALDLQINSIDQLAAGSEISRRDPYGQLYFWDEATQSVRSRTAVDKGGFFNRKEKKADMAAETTVEGETSNNDNDN